MNTSNQRGTALTCYISWRRVTEIACQDWIVSTQWTITNVAVGFIILIVKKLYMRLVKFTTCHITLIVCAPYFVNLNNNTFQLKRYYSLFMYVHSKREQKKSSPIICLRYSELSWDLSSGAVCLGLIRLALYQVPHSVSVLSSAHRARTSTTGCSFLWTPLFAIASESPQHHTCSISCCEIPS